MSPQRARRPIRIVAGSREVALRAHCHFSLAPAAKKLRCTKSTLPVSCVASGEPVRKSVGGSSPYRSCKPREKVPLRVESGQSVLK